jgi:hypothetical protein
MTRNTALTLRAASVRLLHPDGTCLFLRPGQRLTFGRGHEADLVIAGGRDLSRCAGAITALTAGGWIENLSRAHALYVRGDSYHIRLPASGAEGPPGGWLVSHDTAVVGSMAMIRTGRALRVSVAASTATGAPRTVAAIPGGGTEESTQRPLVLQPDTKVYLVALLLCRPWLADPSHSASLLTAPQIARAALELTSASHQLRRLDSDAGFRASLVGQVNDHLKYLRERVQASGLAPAGTRLTPPALAQILLANDVLTRADLAVVDQLPWRSRQEDLWWREGR